MTDLNKFMFMGRLTKDPEMSATKNGIIVAKFTIASNEDKKQADGSWKGEANFIPVKAFGKTAETIGKYSHKGDRVFIEAKVIFSRSEEKFFTNVIVQNYIMLSSKPKSDNAVAEEAEIILNEAWKAGALCEKTEKKQEQEEEYIPDPYAPDVEIPY